MYGTGGMEMSDDLISRKYLLECAEYDNNGRLIIPYRYVKNAPTAFDKEKVIEELKRLKTNAFRYYNQYDDEQAFGESAAYRAAIEIVEKGGLN